MRVLIVDDEPELREQIALSLRQQQYTVDTAGDGALALEKVFADPFDLIVLDLMLPEKDGFTVLRELRAEGVKTPVLMLTAKGEVDSRVKGLDLGADDYLHKPFSMAELLARIRALLRRSHEQISPVLTIGNIRLDTNTRIVTLDNQPVSLTPKEFSLLEFLFYNRNRAISRFTMAEHVWGDAFDPFTMSNNIDVHIKNVRKKLNDQGGRIIVTVRGVGYMAKDEQA
ncbi:two component transcriptional regulator, winged helix family [Desulfobulbus propionicus DSM 2032]|jgi:DNA-binding response OmpR family regulator|uniref:Two component transcriptional regulator, winged helix family n=1 Tax=Desulfobulbus propionicus (strain ATCC 33891 / DSM 2032 / VKM B-1956 / 1pr3) TaxID=577650 RepID=A0A7U4DNR9_DESPD|nr:response regulator transcription factor [Desulfobulbus propionicus]ADW17371.1 two component transcriptional regulator, winged helix family [Desulfobulbus propionicus DSM 2032]